MIKLTETREIRMNLTTDKAFIATKDYFVGILSNLRQTTNGEALLIQSLHNEPAVANKETKSD